MLTFSEEIKLVNKIALEVQKSGGVAYFVGGIVRDELMGKACKDIDIEVHGIDTAVLEGILDSFGERIEIGASFGIYNLKGRTIDIAMPRKETVIGRGHRDFRVEVDPFIGERNAARRRDFTINAIMKNVLTGEIVDPYMGREDLKNGIIRHVCDKSFCEDSLRVLRGAQFAARFGFEIAPETLDLCSRMDLGALSCERVFDELCKALVKAEKPSVFFETLRSMGQLSCWFPEVEKLSGIEQNPEHHPEGDVWTHTMLVLDAAAKKRNTAKNPVGFMLSALTHDLGKITCTETINGVIHAYNHEAEGVPVAKKFIQRLTGETNLIKYVANMVGLHMKPNTMAAHGSSIKATNKMFDESVEPEDLILLALCDDCSKSELAGYESSEPFLRERLEIFYEYMSRPFVKGADLIEAGLLPGKNLGILLGYAHKLRLAGVDKASALKQTVAYARELDKNTGNS